MDCHHCITESAERKKGQHLRMEDRGAIKVLKKLGLGTRAIARQIGCAPSTVTNELRRGTPARKSNKGKAPGYSPKLGEAVYRANRASCHRHPKAGVCSNFTSWVVRQIREHKWSLDACCGYAKRLGLFEPSEMVCSRTLYNMVWKGRLSIQPTELPEALKRKAKKHRVRENKKRYGTSISSRPEIASLRLEEGHWEGDTVVGKRVDQYGTSNLTTLFIPIGATPPNLTSTWTGRVSRTTYYNNKDRNLQRAYVNYTHNSSESWYLSTEVLSEVWR